MRGTLFKQVEFLNSFICKFDESQLTEENATRVPLIGVEQRPQEGQIFEDKLPLYELRAPAWLAQVPPLNSWTRTYKLEAFTWKRSSKIKNRQTVNSGMVNICFCSFLFSCLLFYSRQRLSSKSVLAIRSVWTRRSNYIVEEFVVTTSRSNFYGLQRLCFWVRKTNGSLA